MKGKEYEEKGADLRIPIASKFDTKPGSSSCTSVLPCIHPREIVWVLMVCSVFLLDDRVDWAQRGPLKIESFGFVGQASDGKGAWPVRTAFASVVSSEGHG